MKFARVHGWKITPKEAFALQRELAGRVQTGEALGDWQTLAAADVSHLRGDDRLHAAVVVVRRGSLEIIEKRCVSQPVSFPYVPGLLSFRELPAVLAAFRKLKTRPDVVLCDGQGIAHPRRVGLAAHLGLWLGLPTIGCAKSRLLGTFKEPGVARGCRTPLFDRDEMIGTVLRTRARTKPLFVSVGHRCDLESAVAIVMETATKTRLPLPARLAHSIVNEHRRASP